MDSAFLAADVEAGTEAVDVAVAVTMTGELLS
jgi:hypothetical protein